MAKFKSASAPAEEPMDEATPFAAEPELASVTDPVVETPAEVVPEAPAPEPAFKPAGPSDMVSVNKLGLTRVLIALIQGKDSFNGAGARRAFREIFQCNDEDLEVKWKEVKTYFVGGENYDAIR